MKQKYITQPSVMSLDGPQHRKDVRVGVQKPPKLRFRPGQIVRYEGNLHEVLYVYRLASDPHEWIYALEEKKGLVDSPDALGKLAAAFGCGETTPRIVYEIFRDAGDVHSFFWDIPGNGDRTHVRNKTMIAKAVVVSSGMVVKKGTSE